MAESFTHLGADAVQTTWGDTSSEEATCTIVEETDERAGRVATPSGDVHFVNASGTLPRMGGQIGQKMSDLVGEGPVPFFSTFLARTFETSSLGGLSHVAGWATRRFGAEPIIERFDGRFREAAEAFADAVGIRSESLLKAYALPETFLWLIGTIQRVVGNSRADGLGRAPLGADTSAVVRPPDADTVLHGRNLDVVGIGHWERTATVHFYHPDDGLDYLGVTSAGFLGGGLTAMNAAGVTLAAHQHVVSEFDLQGVPVGVAGDRVMRRARNLDEGIDILRDQPPITGWSYVLSEGDTGECVVYETMPGNESTHRLPEEQARLGHTNAFCGDDLREAEIDVYPEYRRHTLARQDRVGAKVAEILERAGSVGAVEMAELLGDFHDPTGGRTRLAGRTVGSVHTLSSVVFEPESRRVWVGSGHSPAARSWMVPFRLAAADEPGRGGPDRSVFPFHPSPGWERTPHGQSFQLYREACVRESEGESDKRLLILVEHALALFPEDPSLHILAGLLALRSGRARRAEGAFRSALERLTDPPRRAEVTLYLAWSLDLQGQRSSAKQLYHDLRQADAADPHVRRRARTGRWWSFSESRAERLSIDLIHVGAP